MAFSSDPEGQQPSLIWTLFEARLFQIEPLLGPCGICIKQRMRRDVETAKMKLLLNVGKKIAWICGQLLWYDNHKDNYVTLIYNRSSVMQI